LEACPFEVGDNTEGEVVVLVWREDIPWGEEDGDEPSWGPEDELAVEGGKDNYPFPQYKVPVHLLA